MALSTPDFIGSRLARPVAVMGVPVAAARRDSTGLVQAALERGRWSTTGTGVNSHPTPPGRSRSRHLLAGLFAASPVAGTRPQGGMHLHGRNRLCLPMALAREDHRDHRDKWEDHADGVPREGNERGRQARCRRGQHRPTLHTVGRRRGWRRSGGDGGLRGEFIPGRAARAFQRRWVALDEPRRGSP